MIPYLMDHTKTLQALSNDRTNGLGALSEAIEATVVQERNGEFTLQIRLPMTARRNGRRNHKGQGRRRKPAADVQNSKSN